MYLSHGVIIVGPPKSGKSFVGNNLIKKDECNPFTEIPWTAVETPEGFSMFKMEHHIIIESCTAALSDVMSIVAKYDTIPWTVLFVFAGKALRSVSDEFNNVLKKIDFSVIKQITILRNMTSCSSDQDAKFIKQRLHLDSIALESPATIQIFHLPYEGHLLFDIRLEKLKNSLW